MPEAVLPWMHLAGRVLFSSFAIVFGLRHIFALRTTAAYFKRKGIPGPSAVVAATGLMILIGGVFVLLGWHRFIGAGLIFLALFPAGWALHPFWNESDPSVREEELAQFLKVLALAGAALFVAYYSSTEWPLSLGR